MAHFAKIDQFGTVVSVLKVADYDCCDERGHECDEVGCAFLQNLFGSDYDYKQTSYNACKGRHRIQPEPIDGVPQDPIFDTKECCRKNYASIGGKYDYERDAFIPQRPNEFHTVLDEETCHWEYPFQSNQTTDNQGNPLEYTDSSDYSVNSSKNPSGWYWDNTRKTYVKTDAVILSSSAYQYNEETKMWETAPE